MELFFDTYENTSNKDVRVQTSLVVNLLNINPQTHAPPVLMFLWGQLKFRCVLAKANQRYIMFLPTGVPVRAKVQVTFQEFTNGDYETKEVKRDGRLHPALRRGIRRDPERDREGGLQRPDTMATAGGGQQHRRSPLAARRAATDRAQPPLPGPGDRGGALVTSSSSAYSPCYRLAINGLDLPESVRSYITSIRYEDGRDGSDQVTIALANPDLTFLTSHIRGLTVVAPTGISVETFLLAGSAGSSYFDMANQVDLALGYYPDPPTDLFTGEITGVAADFPNGGMPTLTITAHDFLQRTMLGTASRGFGPLPDAAVVAILSVENGLLPLLDPYMIPLDVINTIGNFLFGTSTKQVHQSDFCLLKQIAERFDVGLSVEGNILYLSRFIDREYTPRMTLTYGRSLLEFAPRVSSVGQAIGVTQRVSLREIGVDLILKVYWDLDREAVGVLVLPAAAAILAPAVGSPAVESKHSTIRNAIDVANTVVSLIAQLRMKLNNRLTGTGSAVGDPQIRAAAMIRLDGLGVNFSDVYRVTKAVHTLDGNGYRTQFEAQKEIIP